MHCDQVTVQDADVAHAHAADPQEVVRTRAEQRRIDLEAALDVLLGEDRAASGHAADERQAELLAQRVLQHDAARAPRHQGDYALALQGAQVLLGGVGGAEAERFRDLRTRGWQPVRSDCVLDELEDLALAGREVRHGSPVWMTSDCDYIQPTPAGKHRSQNPPRLFTHSSMRSRSRTRAGCG